jgi:hypothetical protein
MGISGQRSTFWQRWLAVGQVTGGDLGINPLVSADVGIVLAAVARIHRHQFRPCTGTGGDTLQHWLQVFHIRRLVAHTRRHDHLVVTVDSQLAVVAPQLGPA